MQKFIPLEKRSKKEQKKFYAMQRRTWEGFNPVTRVKENGKAYNRKKQGREFRDEGTASFFYAPVCRFQELPADLFRK